jgi:ABC-2 type transport system permease protein
MPLLIVFLAGFVLSKASQDASSEAQVGSLFRLYVLAEPLIIPAMIAAFSIVGEKNGRTLEPLLATPVETWQLLLAKSLAAIIPATLATWISGGIFAVEMAVFTSPDVFAQVVTPGWLILVLVTAPVLTITPVALSVMSSSRFNDPRASSQIASLIFVVLLLVFTTIGRSLVISPLLSLAITAILIVIGIILLRLASAVFQRETILTRWK